MQLFSIILQKIDMMLALLTFITFHNVLLRFYELQWQHDIHVFVIFKHCVHSDKIDKVSLIATNMKNASKVEFMAKLRIDEC